MNTEKPDYSFINFPDGQTPMPIVSIDETQGLIAFLTIDYDMDAPDPRKEFDFPSDEEITAWENGEAFWYNLEIHRLKHSENGKVLDLQTDYRHATPVYIDSCGGYYGYDYMLEDIKRNLNLID